MSKNTIWIGNDHAGVDLKNALVKILKDKHWDVVNVGTNSNESVDYPDYAHPVAEAVEKEKGKWGILICGSANGVCMSANKHQGVRAALCWNSEIASLARSHNDANVLCIPARYVSIPVGAEILEAFLNQEFEGGRHQKRVNKISINEHE